MPDAIEAMRSVFALMGSCAVSMPERAVTEVENVGGAHLSMPCYLAGDRPVLSLKAVSLFPANADRGEPTTQGVLLLHCPVTGMPVALMDAEYLTLVRTGAVSALASRYLAKQTVTTIGLIGAGHVGEFQVRAMLAEHPGVQVKVYDLITKRAEDLAKKLSGQAVTHDEAAGCDIVCLATTSAKPVLFGSQLKPGAFATGVGSFKPSMCEVDSDVLLKSTVYVDYMPAAQKSAGEIISAVNAGKYSWSQVQGELGELVRGDLEGRREEQERIFFKSVGLAAQDAAVASLVFERAQELGLGTQANLS